MDLLSALTEAQDALNVASSFIPVTSEAGAAIKMEQALERLFIAANHAYQIHKGEPYDLSKLPKEDTI